MKKCSGCGITLQFTDKDKLGFIPEHKYKEASYCERCFKLTHYNNSIVIPLKDINDKIIKEINKNKKYVFYLLDFLNINSETIETFKMLNKEKTLVINKLDIIPRSIKLNKIKDWLRNEYNIEDNIVFTSSNKDINTTTITNLMEKNNIKESYIVGYTNSGKSTLINNLCNKFNPLNNQITTSLLPNTTLDFIKIKLNKDITIIDSPGFTLKETLYKESE